MYRNCIKVGAFLIISGCASFGKPDVKSSWGALSDAKSMDCKPLPLMPDDLRIDKVRVLASTGPSLLLETSSRKGVRNFYHLAFRKPSELTPEKLVKLPISQDARFLGAGIANGKALLVVHAYIKEKPFIQIRDLSNNALLFQISTKLKSFELGDWRMADDRLYALIREDRDEESVDDQVYQELSIPLSSDKGLTLTATKVTGFGSSSFSDGEGKRWTMTLDKGTSVSKKEARFRIWPWGQGLKAKVLELDEKGPVESWTLFEGPRTVSLAFVKGDSLLWENTSLEVQTLSPNEPFSKQVSASLPLTQVHVAQPILAANTLNQFVYLPQWLDHEISVAVYKLDGSQLEPSGFLGVFKEGTAFESAFWHEPSEAFYLISRYGVGAVPKYSLCEAEL